MPQALPPVDPNVKLPSRVTAASQAADAMHAQAYQTPEPAPQPQPQPPSSPTEAPAAAAPPAPQPLPPAAPQPEPPAPSAPQPAPHPQPAAERAPAAGDLSQEEWRHRYLSMEGRYKQAAQSLGGMQEQMSEMGDELMRMQAALEQQRNQQPRAPQPVRLPAPEQYLTPDEIQAYGPELLSVIQRAARAALMPDMQNLQTGTQQAISQVSQRVQQVSQVTLYTMLDEQVPTWRLINNDQRFKAWCSLPDVYSGQLRGKLLKDAFQAGQAARVIAFFKGFLAEEQATGQLPDPSVQPQPPAVPRTPAIPLDTLTAPGRAKPAPGEQPGAPADKPIFTRAQIAAFYTAVRQGQYHGRDNDKNALEQQIFAAQRDGRVR